MIELSLREFYDGNFEDLGYQLYILREAGQAMYIGISEVSIWERWFGGNGSHMLVHPNDRLTGNSIIGDVIARRLPESWKWKIELWTKEDCINALLEEIAANGRQWPESMKMYDLEALLINKIMPRYNTMHTGGSGEDPLTTHALDAAYRRIFNKE